MELRVSWRGAWLSSRRTTLHFVLALNSESRLILVFTKCANLNTGLAGGRKTEEKQWGGPVGPGGQEANFSSSPYTCSGNLWKVFRFGNLSSGGRTRGRREGVRKDPEFCGEAELGRTCKTPGLCSTRESCTTRESACGIA